VVADNFRLSAGGAAFRLADFYKLANYFLQASLVKAGFVGCFSAFDS